MSRNQIREQRQRRGCVAAKLAPEAQREAPGPSLRDRLRGLVAGPFEGEGRALEYEYPRPYSTLLVCQYASFDPGWRLYGLLEARDLSHTSSPSLRCKP